MMAEKVKVSREVADAIELYIDDCTRVLKLTLENSKAVLIAEHYKQDWAKYEIGQYLALNDIDTFTLMQAMVNDYEVEETPEEKLLMRFQHCEQRAGWHQDDEREMQATANAIKETLNTLNIQIKGINK